jgi:hypothetical protein
MDVMSCIARLWLVHSWNHLSGNEQVGSPNEFRKKVYLIKAASFGRQAVRINFFGMSWRHPLPSYEKTLSPWRKPSLLSRRHLSRSCRLLVLRYAYGLLRRGE